MPDINPLKLGRYEIQSEIGRGAMGVVYRAIDPVLDRTVAIKTIGLSQDQTERAEYEARFYQEARAAGGLSHPNIVTVYDVGDSGDVAYMAMEFLDGSELSKLRGEANQPMPAEQAVDIAAQVAEGLGYAHERGVVHRDIKPANIMVLQNGIAKITDFGIARMRQSEVKTQTGMLLGSPRYMSPEVVVGQRADGRSDVFSLGIILYELLTGTPPFAGESMTALMYQTINFVPSPPSTANPAVPTMLDFIVAKMLAKKRDERYQDAKELASDLRACRAQMGQAPGDARGVAAATAQPAPSLLDAEAKAQLLAGTLPMTRVTDADKEADTTAPALGVSRVFDSLEATRRLAVQTGMTKDLEAADVTSIKPAAPAPGEAAATRLPGTSGGVLEPSGTADGEVWGPREWRVLGLGLAAATVIAAAIAFA